MFFSYEVCIDWTNLQDWSNLTKRYLTDDKGQIDSMACLWRRFYWIHLENEDAVVKQVGHEQITIWGEG